MNDSQAAEEAFVRHRENCVVCRTSGMHLGNLGKRCPVGGQLMETWFKAEADEEDAPRETPKHWLQSLVSRDAMTRRQGACIVFGFLLIVLSLLFPPSHPYRSVLVSYRFLFTGQGTIDFARLFVEWVLIALVTSVLFFSQQSKSSAPAGEGENARGDRSGKLLQRKIVIPIVVALAVTFSGLAYYGSKRIGRNLPQPEVAKLDGGAQITNYGQFVWNAYNGSSFVLGEVRVSISVYNEKGNAVISNRVYRVPAFDFYPQQTKQLSTDVGFTLGEGQRLEWLIVGARGRPE